MGKSHIGVSVVKKRLGRGCKGEYSSFLDILQGPDVLGYQFAVPTFMVYQVICERLESVHRTKDASECFRQMVADMMEQNSMHDTQVEWVLCKWARVCMLSIFKRCFPGKLERLGDANMKAELHGNTISGYSTALGLHPTSQHLFVQRKGVLSLRYARESLPEIAYS